jgi:hypothetical protein
LCNEIATKKVFIVFEREGDFKNVSFNEFNILLFFITNFQSALFKDIKGFGKINKTYEKICKIVETWFMNYRKRKVEYDR